MERRGDGAAGIPGCGDEDRDLLPRRAVHAFERGGREARAEILERAGRAMEQFERPELEKRLIVMQGCYDADKFTIGDEQPGDNGKRIMKVDLTKGPVTKSPRFTTVKGPSDRWYVEDADFGAVTALCRQK